ncbi:MAG: Flp pilus assembly protein CpaB [Mycobacteriales bacterium]|nr:Flp pilus assembly protein CpaB [Frankia sp.]
MGRRTVLLIAAVVLAALGTLLVFAYVHNVDNRALAKQQPVRVLVAKTRITAGTRAADAASRGDFELRELPRAAVAASALSDIEPVKDQVAISDIFAGEQILSVKFAAVGSSTGPLSVPAGKIAVAVQVGDPERVAGFVQPGAFVAVFATIQPSTVGGGAAAQFTKLLLPRVQVIGVGPATLRSPDAASGQTGEATSAILTLALDQMEAQRTILASQAGRLYFALLTPDSRVGRAPAVDLRNLFP